MLVMPSFLQCTYQDKVFYFIIRYCYSFHCMFAHHRYAFDLTILVIRANSSPRLHGLTLANIVYDYQQYVQTKYSTEKKENLKLMLLCRTNIYKFKKYSFPTFLSKRHFIEFTKLIRIVLLLKSSTLCLPLVYQKLGKLHMYIQETCARLPLSSLNSY